MSKKSKQIRISGDDIQADNSSWTFSGDIPLKFDKHISKSVPLYKEGHNLILELSDFFLSNNATCYDIGCSTGTLLQLLAERHKNKNVRYIGIDEEIGMTNIAQRKIDAGENIELICADINSEPLKKSDFIISYYTIQFIKPKFRQNLFDKIYKSLNWGGAFILFEKVRSPDARFQDIMSQVYMSYKYSQGYTADEILNKSRSLKGILEPYTESENIMYLKRAGFKDYTSIMKYICFEGILVIK